MDAQEVILALREAGKVVRNHTMPRHRDCHLAEHYHNMTAMYLVLCQNPKVEVIRAINVHDLAERWLGDVPAPAKSEFLQAREEKVLQHFGLGFDLSPEDEAWVKSLDKLDLLMWCEDERAMGNRNVEHMLRAVEDWFLKYHAIIPIQLLEFQERYKWRRLRDVVPGD